MIESEFIFVAACHFLSAVHETRLNLSEMNFSDGCFIYVTSEAFGVTIAVDL